MPLPFPCLVATLVETSSDEPPKAFLASLAMVSCRSPPLLRLGSLTSLLFFWPVSASSFLAPKPNITEPSKDKRRPLAPHTNASSSEANAFLDTVIDWVPGTKCMRVGNLPNSFGTKDGDDDFLLNFILDAIQNTTNRNPTLVEGEHDPTPVEGEHGVPQVAQFQGTPIRDLCAFRSITFLTQEQLVEFEMGLANSKKPFLWIVRPDLVNRGYGTSANADLPREFLEETKGKGLISGWCPQEEVLEHPSIGGFLTHCGWNSMVESLSAGVPMLRWPCFGDQKGNCRYVGSEWEMGLKIGSEVHRDDVERLVRKLNTDDGDDDEVGKKLKKRTMVVKKMAHEAALGSSTLDFNKLVNYPTSIQN